MNGELPNQEISGMNGKSKCTSINMRSTTVVGQLEDSSYFKFGGNINWKDASATVFAEASLDSAITINTKITVKKGTKIPKFKKFKVKMKCKSLAHKTVRVELKTQGKTALGLQMTAKLSNIEPSTTKGESRFWKIFFQTN